MTHLPWRYYVTVEVITTQKKHGHPLQAQWYQVQDASHAAHGRCTGWHSPCLSAHPGPPPPAPTTWFHKAMPCQTSLPVCTDRHPIWSSLPLLLCAEKPWPFYRNAHLLVLITPPPVCPFLCAGPGPRAFHPHHHPRKLLPYYPHFMYEKIKEQRGKVPGPRSLS